LRNVLGHRKSAEQVSSNTKEINLFIKTHAALILWDLFTKTFTDTSLIIS
jgi:hypothetical protein